MSFWNEMSELFCFGLGEDRNHEGVHACFCLHLTKQMVRKSDHILIKASVNDEAQIRCANQGLPTVERPHSFTTGGTVLLKATYQDYEALLRHVSEVKVLQAFVACDGDTVILDAVNNLSFFAGATEVQRHEVLQAAEIFAGGFAGWSRALFSIRDGGVRTHMSWMLERDSACCTALQAMDDNVVTITSAEDIPAATQPCDTALLSVDFRQTWWRKVLHLRPVHLAFVSPPCQPWSRAGKGEGLASQDGSILLELAQLLQVTNIPVVVLEELEGFPHHKDFGTVCAAMRQAGYCCRWKATLQLSDVAPASRRRFFMVWVREEWPSQPKHVADCRWQPNGRSTFASAKAVFDCLPKGLLEPCMLEPDVLQLYMMPELLPQGPNGKRPHDVRSARVRSADQPAACF